MLSQTKKRERGPMRVVKELTVRLERGLLPRQSHRLGLSIVKRLLGLALALPSLQSLLLLLPLLLFSRDRLGLLSRGGRRQHRRVDRTACRRSGGRLELAFR